MMDERAAAIPFRRIKGGFRRMLDTELGTEQLCCSCGELWPVDPEFYVVTATRLSYECRACTSERQGERKAQRKAEHKAGRKGGAPIAAA